eukprot:GAFH01000017.1.p4 GENE.GAFH01000017.1~~GAFH01000017.1.p4  ORF type:complete len:63 (+),score=4.32 GAFH01000017.1:358-546(+)
MITAAPNNHTRTAVTAGGDSLQRHRSFFSRRWGTVCHVGGRQMTRLIIAALAIFGHIILLFG